MAQLKNCSDWPDEALVRDAVTHLTPYQPGMPVSEVKRKYGLTEVIKLASNENALGPSPVALRALAEAAGQLHMYPDGSSYDLRHGLAKLLGVHMDQVIVGNGSDELIKLIAEVFLNPGDEVISWQPGFTQYGWAAHIMGANHFSLPMRDFQYGLADLQQVLSPATRLVCLASPNNPTGTILTRSQLEQLLEMLPAQALLILDEAYGEFVDRPDYPDGLDYVKAGHRILLLRTFSKVYGLAGLRIGYGIGSPAAIDYLQRVRNPFNANSLAQAAALAALSDKEHAQASRIAARQGRTYLTGGLTEMGVKVVPGEANFLLVDTGYPAPEVFEGLLRQGIIVRPCQGFGLPTYLRISVGTPGQNEMLLEALAQVLADCRRKYDYSGKE
jgi:histidinol-phosphate aminotransferase